MAKKALDELLTDMDDVQLEEVEIMTNPLRALKDGVKFIPTLKSGDERLSGILLNRKKIKAFLDKIQNL
ncbi:MAG TPA: hypothetical protein EYH36_01145 [Desulfocapsa sulfexigens]|nr:hypothetical protein [Desulfocapsa sulfexigens]